MKKQLILLFACISIVVLASGQLPYKQDLLNLATVNFPAQPDTGGKSNQKIFTFKGENVLYNVVVTNMAKTRNFKLADGELDKFYDEVVRGIVKAANGILVHKKDFNIAGLKGVEIEYTSTALPNFPNLGFQRILFFNNTGFTVGFWVDAKDRFATLAEKDKFFSSFTITAKKESLVQYNVSKDESEPAYRVGYLAGKLVGYLFVIGVVVGIVFLIIKLSKRLGKNRRT